MDVLAGLIEDLKAEAVRIQAQARPLRLDEMSRVKAIHQALPHLTSALGVLTADAPAPLITYKIVTDRDGRLKESARIACNFWNRFVVPRQSIVIRLDLFTADSTTIARAYEPYQKDAVVYGVVEFNTKYLDQFSESEVAGTIAHEVGHTLGFGWEQWRTLFDSATGEFKTQATARLPTLAQMRVETDYGPGTCHSHWDEQRHDQELMTGIKDAAEHVLPVTIDIMQLLGHQVCERLPHQADLDTLLRAVSLVAFSRKDEARAIDRDHFEVTEIWEEIPHHGPA